VSPRRPQPLLNIGFSLGIHVYDMVTFQLPHQWRE
jgi:hypothetical protein